MPRARRAPGRIRTSSRTPSPTSSSARRCSSTSDGARHSGSCWRRPSSVPAGVEPKPIVERVRADGPLLPPLGLGMARWIASRYLPPPALVLRAMLPPGMLERLGARRGAGPGRGRDRGPGAGGTRPARSAGGWSEARARPRRARGAGRSRPTAPRPRGRRRDLARLDIARRLGRPALRALDRAHAAGQGGGGDAGRRGASARTAARSTTGRGPRGAHRPRGDRGRRGCRAGRPARRRSCRAPRFGRRSPAWSGGAWSPRRSANAPGDPWPGDRPDGAVGGRRLRT